MEHTAAHAEDHRAVTTQEGFKGCLVLPGDEGLQQLPVGHSCRILRQYGPAQMLDDRAHGTGCHQLPSVAGMAGPLFTISRSKPVLYTLFFDLASGSPIQAPSSTPSAP